MNLTRPIMFWIATCAAVIAAVVLLREILLPFVAGLVLAYLFNPLANRLERVGLNRLLAALLIIVLFVVGFVALVLLTAPIIARELAYLLDLLYRHIPAPVILASFHASTGPSLDGPGAARRAVTVR
jgi:predicted PurR-regulated permease PerM